MPLQLYADGGYQLRLGVLGVPLIMVRDKTIAGFLKLVELCKGLVVEPCLTSLLKVYEVRSTPWQMGNTTYG
jgi:hypothetical protein